MTREQIEKEIENLERQQQQGREMVSQGTEVVQQTAGAIKALRFVLTRMQQEAAASRRCEPAGDAELAAANGECRG